MSSVKYMHCALFETKIGKKQSTILLKLKKSVDKPRGFCYNSQRQLCADSDKRV